MSLATLAMPSAAETPVPLSLAGATLRVTIDHGPQDTMQEATGPPPLTVPIPSLPDCTNSGDVTLSLANGGVEIRTVGNFNNTGATACALIFEVLSFQDLSFIVPATQERVTPLVPSLSRPGPVAGNSEQNHFDSDVLDSAFYDTFGRIQLNFTTSHILRKAGTIVHLLPGDTITIPATMDGTYTFASGTVQAVDKTLRFQIGLPSEPSATPAVSSMGRVGLGLLFVVVFYLLVARRSSPQRPSPIHGD